MAEQPTGSTVVELRSISGEVLATVRLCPNDVAAIKMKEALASLGDSLLPRFLYAGKLISEHMLVKDVGFPEMDLVEVFVIVDSRAAFQWRHCTDPEGVISEDGGSFRRGCTASRTHGVRAAACFPRGVRCYLALRPVGTHASFGVGTKSVELEGDGYQHLFGKDENSWAITFGGPNPAAAQHAGKAFKFQTAGLEGPAVPSDDEQLQWSQRIDRECGLQMSFLLELDGNFHVWGPGAAEHEDLVVPFQVPQDAEVYVVAATVYGSGLISISQTPFLRPPQHFPRKAEQNVHEPAPAADAAEPATAANAAEPAPAADAAAGD